MHRRHWLITILIVLFSLTVVAQTEDCAAFVQQAFDIIGDNCNGIARNQVCYGNNPLRVSFQEVVEDNFFTQPSDLAELTTVERVEAFPYVPQTAEWGIAVLSVQANVPNTNPGQAVTFMLLGDTQVQNHIAAEDAFLPTDTVVIEVPAGTNFRSGPGLTYNVIGNSGGGGEFTVDFISTDGEWLRILIDSTPMWVFRELIENEPPEVADLPVLKDETRTPMQTFYFTTGITPSGCQDAPNALVIQSAPAVAAVLDMNGMGIIVGGTGVFRFAEDNVVQIIVFEGSIYLDNTFVIPYSATAFIHTLDDGTIIPGTGFGFRPITDLEYDQFLWMETYNNSFFHELGEFERQPQYTSCDTFIRTAPISDTIPAAPVDFYWNPPLITELTSYQLLFYNENNQPTDSFFVGGQTTTMRLDTGQLNTGSVLRWEVLAYVGDEIVCTTPVGAFQVIESRPDDVIETENDDDDDDGGNRGGSGGCTGITMAACGHP